jgi:hypothetical protein
MKKKPMIFGENYCLFLSQKEIGHLEKAHGFVSRAYPEM